MSKRVAYKLYGEDAKYITDFANAVGQPIEQIAKVALYQYVKDTLDKAEKMAREAQIQTEPTTAVESTEP